MPVHTLVRGWSNPRTAPSAASQGTRIPYHSRLLSQATQSPSLPE